MSIFSKKRAPEKTIGPKAKLAKISQKLNRFDRVNQAARSGTRLASFGLFTAILTPRKFLPIVATSVGLQTVALALGSWGHVKKGALLAQCVGRARISANLASRVKDRFLGEELIVIGSGKYNLTEKEALKAVYRHNATHLEKRYAEKAYDREKKRLIAENKI